MKTNLRIALLALVCVLCSLAPIGAQAMTEATSEGEYNYSVYLDNRKLPGDMMYVYVHETMGTGNNEIVSNEAMTLNADGLWEYSFTTSKALMQPIVYFTNGNGEYTATYLFENGKTYVVEEICVDGVYYRITSIDDWSLFNEVEVTYRGMSYYEHANEYSGAVVLPSSIMHEGVEYSVVNIGNNAFRNCAELTSVTIPESVFGLGKWSFAGCENLQSVVIPKNVNYINENAFYNCNALGVIYVDAIIPPTVQENTFKGLDKSIPVIVPAGSEEIYKNAQYWKDFTNIVSNNEGASKYTWVARLKNSQLSGFPMYVYMWDAGDNNKELLGGWPGVPMHYLSDGTWMYAFQTDYELKQPMIIFNNGSSDEQTEDLVFENNKVYELLDQFTIEGITYKTSSGSTAEVVSGAGCSGAVVIPDVVEYDYKSYYVTSIADAAFQGCTQLTSISIPRTLQRIGAYVFDACPALKRVEWNAIYATTARDGVMMYPPFLNYESRICSVEEMIFGDEVTLIPTALCLDMKLLKKVELPATLTSIGDYAFAFCEELQSVTSPESLTAIGDEAFSGCSTLSTITIPYKVAFVGINAFQDCTNLTSVKWDAVACEIYHDGNYFYPPFIIADNGVSGINSFVFGDKVEFIPKGLCWGLANLQSVALPQSVKCIDDYAFYTSGLQSVTVPANVKRLGVSSFWGCEALESVTLAEGLQEIGNYAFSRCTNLKSIVVPNSVQTLGDEAFWGCSSLQSATIGDGVTYIGNYTFSRCENLASVELGKNISALGQEVFWSCSSLGSITLPERLTEIGQWCFEKCTSLRDVYALPAVPPTIYDGTFTYDVTSNATLHTSPDSKSAYAKALYWRDFSSIVGDLAGLNHVSEDNYKVVVTDGALSIEGVADNAVVNIYSTNGALLYVTTVADIATVALPQGVYFVQVEGVTCKVAI